MPEPTTTVTVVPLENGALGPVRDDAVVTEAPLELRIGDVPIAVVMRTPGADADLAHGFVLTEGILFGPEEIAGIDPLGDGDRLAIIPAPGVTIDAEQFRRNLYTTSSCGVCGKASIDAVRITARSVGAGPELTAEGLEEMASRLRAGQAAFDVTGGLHGAALFDQGGGLVALAEDVGRHNAVDKTIGAAARSTWPLTEHALMVSGRVSFEIVQKAAVAGVSLVAGISAASSLAVELAHELGITVIGFVRSGRATIYAHPHRIVA